MSVFTAIFPVIAIAFLGWLARRRNWLADAEAAAIERISLWFLIPCLLFLGTATANFPETLDWSYLLAFYLTVVVVYVLGMLVGRICFGLTLCELGAFGMGGAYSNVTVLGIPIIVELLGEAAFVPMFLIISVHNLVLFTTGTVIAEIGHSGTGALHRQLRRVVQEVLLNPISGSLIAGALWNLFDVPLYAPAQATLELLSRAAVPGALFALGAALTRYHVRGEIPAALTMVVLKLMLMPLLMWTVMTQLFEVSGVELQVAVLLSGMPTGISVYVFSKRYQVCETAAAAAIVISSLGAVVTLAAVVALLR